MASCTWLCGCFPWAEQQPTPAPTSPSPPSLALLLPEENTSVEAHSAFPSPLPPLPSPLFSEGSPLTEADSPLPANSTPVNPAQANSSSAAKVVPLTCHGHSRPVTHLSFSGVDDDDQYYIISACKGMERQLLALHCTFNLTFHRQLSHAT